MTLSAQAYRILETAASGALDVTWLSKGRTRWSINADATEVFALVNGRLLIPLPAETDAEYPRTCQYVPTEEGYKLWQEQADQTALRAQS